MGTEFYLAGALAFLIAMLGWADQIRGTQERTRFLEKELLEQHKFRWSDLQPLVRPENPDRPQQRLAAVLRVLNTGQLAHSLDVRLLTSLEKLNQVRGRLERRYHLRFWLVFATAVEMFVAGVASTIVSNWTPTASLALHPYRTVTLTSPISSDQFFAGVSLILIGAILYGTWQLNLDEERMRTLIADVDDKLRSAKDARARPKEQT